jgi:predicted XRE-type DNA-binding protein
MNNEKHFDHSGSAFDSFLEEEGILEKTEAVALKRVVAWKLEQAMKEKKVSKYTLAKELHTSRSQVDRLLDPSHIGVTIGTISRAARMLGKRIRVEIVDAKRKHTHHAVGAAKPRSNRYAKAAAAGAD